ncbi:MAG: type 4a pilus biogenesis protein PilO [Candidatus Azambacteria bacterium]|nr:type 4a pilus biogenesis protein PilO [Candidatus Azambacteria bacterium]
MDRRYLVAGLFFVVAMIIATMLVYPKYQAMRSSGQIAVERQRAFDSQIALAQDINRLKSQYKEVKKEFAVVEQLIPLYDEQSDANLFVELEGLTARSGVLLDAISFSKNKTIGKQVEKRYHTTNAQISLKSDYRSFKNFMRSIETSGHLMDLTLISVSAAGGEGEDGADATQQLLTMKISIDAYYQ